MKLYVCNSSTNRYAIILNLYNLKFYRIMFNVDVHIYKFSERQMIDETHLSSSSFSIQRKPSPEKIIINVHVVHKPDSEAELQKGIISTEIWYTVSIKYKIIYQYRGVVVHVVEKEMSYFLKQNTDPGSFTVLNTNRLIKTCSKFNLVPCNLPSKEELMEEPTSKVRRARP